MNSDYQSKQKELSEILDVNKKKLPDLFGALELFNISQAEYIKILNQTKVVDFQNSSETTITEPQDAWLD